jgi:hypothetical protein
MRRALALFALFVVIAGGSAVAAGAMAGSEPSVHDQFQQAGLLGGQATSAELEELMRRYELTSGQLRQARHVLEFHDTTAAQRALARSMAGMYLAPGTEVLHAQLLNPEDREKLAQAVRTHQQQLGLIEQAIASLADMQLSASAATRQLAATDPWARVDAHGALVAGSGVESVTGQRVTFDRDVSRCAASVTPDTKRFVVGTAQVEGRGVTVALHGQDGGAVAAGFSLTLRCA